MFLSLTQGHQHGISLPSASSADTGLNSDQLLAKALFPAWVWVYTVGVTFCVKIKHVSKCICPVWLHEWEDWIHALSKPLVMGGGWVWSSPFFLHGSFVWTSLLPLPPHLFSYLGLILSPCRLWTHRTLDFFIFYFTVRIHQRDAEWPNLIRFSWMETTSQWYETYNCTHSTEIFNRPYY